MWKAAAGVSTRAPACKREKGADEGIKPKDLRVQMPFQLETNFRFSGMKRRKAPSQVGQVHVRRDEYLYIDI